MLPDEILHEILKFLDTCPKKNKYYLISKLWFKLINPNKCKPVIIFNKKICYYHNKRIVDVLNLDFQVKFQT